MCAVRTGKISCPAPWSSPPKALDTLHQGLRLYVRGLSNLLDGCGMDVASGRPFAIRVHAGLDLVDLVAQGPRSRFLDPALLVSLRTASLPHDGVADLRPEPRQFQQRLIEALLRGFVIDYSISTGRSGLPITSLSACPVPKGTKVKRNGKSAAWCSKYDSRSPMRLLFFTMPPT